ncbi:MAG: alanine dehydrogenase [Pseudomonadota bacterium]|nr:alanine dehydrogenase [Pseudomonadota bacterium]
MHIAIPKETKPHEGRVALLPDACDSLIRRGHVVTVQSQAGEASGYSDAHYQRIGVEVAADAAATYAAGELIVKVKEPLPAEWARLRDDHRLFSFLHLAAAPDLVDALCRCGLTAWAFETVKAGEQFPLLAPMSRIAGVLAIHQGARWLQGVSGGRGVLMGRMPGVPRARVVVVGCGQAGLSAIGTAAALGVSVEAFDLRQAALDAAAALGANVTTLYPHGDALADAVAAADLVVGAVLVPGRRAPAVITEAMVQRMRPGTVIVDISIDQGGCVETMEPRGYDDPAYLRHGVWHLGVANLPGAVPRTASQALSAALLPYVAMLASSPLGDEPAELASALSIRGGKLVDERVRAERELA